MENKERITKVECLNREALELAFALACRQLHKVVNATSEQVSLRAIRQDMMNKAVQQMEENQRSLPARRRNRHELGLKGIKEITSDDYIVEVEDNGWIPVEERLPEDTNGDFYQSVIVTLSNGRVASGVYRNYDDEWWVEDESGKKKYMRSNEIIAWMPLPEPSRIRPEGEGRA